MTAACRPLLEKAGVSVDDAVVDLGSGVDKFIKAAKSRVWSREAAVRTLA